jgi:hypothetical protein
MKWWKSFCLTGAGVFHADHHLRQQVLEDPRRGEIVGRADLAEIVHDRLGRLRAVDGEPGDQRLRKREQMVADPGHRQVGEDVFVGRSAIDLHAAAGGADECGMCVRQTPFGLPVVPDV